MIVLIVWVAPTVLMLTLLLGYAAKVTVEDRRDARHDGIEALPAKDSHVQQRVTGVRGVLPELEAEADGQPSVTVQAASSNALEDPIVPSEEDPGSRRHWHSA